MKEKTQGYKIIVPDDMPENEVMIKLQPEIADVMNKIQEEGVELKNVEVHVNKDEETDSHIIRFIYQNSKLYI